MTIVLPVRRSEEWVPVPRRNYLMQCCDCGLMHRVDFRIRRGVLQMRAWRLTPREALKAVRALNRSR